MSTNLNTGFRIIGGVGFHITFENGWTVSALWGPGNYADNYRMKIGTDEDRAGMEGSSTAECAVIGPDGNLVNRPGWGGTVDSFRTPADVLELLNWAAAQPGDPCGDTS